MGVERRGVIIGMPWGVAGGLTIVLRTGVRHKGVQGWGQTGGGKAREGSVVGQHMRWHIGQRGKEIVSLSQGQTGIMPAQK